MQGEEKTLLFQLLPGKHLFFSPFSFAMSLGVFGELPDGLELVADDDDGPI